MDHQVDGLVGSAGGRKAAKITRLDIPLRSDPMFRHLTDTIAES